MNGSNTEDPFHHNWFVFEEPVQAATTRQVRFATGTAQGKASTVQRSPHNGFRQNSKKRTDPRATTSSGQWPSRRVFAFVLLLVVAALLAFSYTLQDTGIHGLRRFLHSSRSDESRLPSEISALLEEYVDRAVQGLLQQRVHGMRDFAFAADGARIVPALTSGDPVSQKTNSPDVVLRDNLAGGRCFSIGTSGQIGVAIPALIFPSHLTVEHIPKRVAEDIGQAPRRMRWWGAVDGKQNRERYNEYLALAGGSAVSLSPPFTHGYTFVHLGDFEYDIHGDNHVQTFAVHDLVHQFDMYFGVFVVEVLDNWGGSSTCLYRLRIHGHIAAK